MSAIGAAVGVPLGFIVAVVGYPFKRTCIFDVVQLCPSELVDINDPRGGSPTIGAY